MGTWILVVALVSEVGYTGYCLATRSRQRRIQGYLRIGALLAFVLLALISVIQWSFRWYILAFLLFVWGVWGIWDLVRRPLETAEFRPAGAIWRGVATLVLVMVAVTPGLIFPQFTLPPATGGLPVSTALYSYTDTSRVETYTDTGAPREVNVEFWYPQDGGGPYPLIVFSHGTAGTKTSNASTFMDLASHGYVVCSIDHPYQALITVDASGSRVFVDRTYLQEFLDINNGKLDEATTFRIEQAWMDLRTADINFVLDTVLEKAANPEQGSVYGLIDPTRIGLMGHSMGGAATAEVARERTDVDAEVDLDADLMGDYLAYADGKYVMNDKPYPVPLLVVYADDLVRLMDAIPDANEVVAVKRAAAVSDHVYQVHLEGTNHLSLTDVSLASPFLVSLVTAAVPKAGGQAVDSYATLQRMNGIVLNFFDSFLKGDGSFSVAGD